MNKKRLLKLAELLDADAGNRKGVKFDLSVWVAPSGDRTFSDIPDEKIEVSCSTTACAMGLAVISGAFKRAGLSATYEKSLNGGYFLQPEFKGRIGFGAAAELFGIESAEAEWLFASEHYDGLTFGGRGERKVAKRIRDFVDGHIGPP